MPCMQPAVRRAAIWAVLSTLGVAIAPIRALVAQELPPIYETVPVALVPAEAIAQLPVNTFLENVVTDAAGTLYITSHEDGKILQVLPGQEPTVYASVDGKVAGIALTEAGQLLVSGADPSGLATLFLIAAGGAVETLATLPDAIFLNGVTHLAGDRYLIADSYKGAIWEVDLATKATRLWLEHPLLARRSADSPIPAVNGLKRQGNLLYVSNTDQQLMVTIPIDAMGAAGTPTVLIEQVNIDDFAFDARGNLYGATHIYNSVVKISPDGVVTTIAEIEAGMTGSTALAFGKTAGDRTSLYVVTNGGMFLPPPEGVLPAQIVRLEVGEKGASLD